MCINIHYIARKQALYIAHWTWSLERFYPLIWNQDLTDLSTFMYQLKTFWLMFAAHCTVRVFLSAGHLDASVERIVLCIVYNMYSWCTPAWLAEPWQGRTAHATARQSAEFEKWESALWRDYCATSEWQYRSSLNQSIHLRLLVACQNDGAI